MAAAPPAAPLSPPTAARLSQTTAPLAAPPSPSTTTWHFNNNSTAGSAALLNNVGALIDFSNTTGLIGDHKVSAGSIAGAGSYNLGANELTVGSNNLSTEVSGVIAGTGGSLVKVGTRTLTLSGNNTYTGGTTINGGTLQLGNAVGIMGSILGAITVGSGAKFGVFGADTSGITSIQTAENYISSTIPAPAARPSPTTPGGNLCSNSFKYLAGGATINNNGGGTLIFNDTSTAGSATITNNGQLTFYGHTTAVSATITNSGTVLFDGDSTPGAARLINTTAGADINFYTPGLIARARSVPARSRAQAASTSMDQNSTVGAIICRPTSRACSTVTAASPATH